MSTVVSTSWPEADGCGRLAGRVQPKEPHAPPDPRREHRSSVLARELTHAREARVASAPGLDRSLVSDANQSHTYFDMHVEPDGTVALEPGSVAEEAEAVLSPIADQKGRGRGGRRLKPAAWTSGDSDTRVHAARYRFQTVTLQLSIPCVMAPATAPEGSVTPLTNPKRRGAAPAEKSGQAS
jgi:hypothetical protein